MENWVEFLNKNEFINTSLITNNLSADFLEDACKYDLVTGYNSTIMLQTYMIGIPTIYYDNNHNINSLKLFKNNVNIKEIQYLKYGDFIINSTKNVTDKIIQFIKEENNLK